jgi:Cu2+-exporting ATPase
VPVFVGAVLVASLFALIAWLFIDPARALSIAVAVLIVTCPCALALATPVAMTVATGALARANVAVTRGSAIEALAMATHVVFDKTGTLTSGTPELVATLPAAGGEPGHALGSPLRSHRVRRTVRRGLREAAATAGLRIPLSSGHRSEPGRGIEAVIDGERHRAGRADYVAEIAGPGVQGGQIAPFAPGFAIGSFLLPARRSGSRASAAGSHCSRSAIRRAPRRLTRSPHSMRWASAFTCCRATTKRIARSVAAELGICHVRAQTTPDGKCAYVARLQAAGARVAMVGDGINDAPVLAQADVSIADELGRRPREGPRGRGAALGCSGRPRAALRIARRTRAVIRQNLGWALGYNLVAIPLAVTGQLSPLIAGIGMSASSLLVVVNSLRAR